jgi:hypothetical protein
MSPFFHVFKDYLYLFVRRVWSQVCHRNYNKLYDKYNFVLSMETSGPPNIGDGPR